MSYEKDSNMTGFQQRFNKNAPQSGHSGQGDPSVRRMRATVTFHLGAANTKINKDQIVGWDGYSLYMGSRVVEMQGIDGAILKKWLVDLDDDYEYSPAPAKMSKDNPIKFATEDNIEAEMKIEKNGSLTPKKLPNGMTVQPTQQRTSQMSKVASQQQRVGGFSIEQEHRVPVMQISKDSKGVSSATPLQAQKPPAPTSKAKKGFRLGSVGIEDEG